jgi:hypothetical protein
MLPITLLLLPIGPIAVSDNQAFASRSPPGCYGIIVKDPGGIVGKADREVSGAARPPARRFNLVVLTKEPNRM